MPIKVLVVDDSALIRQILSEIVTRDPGLTLVGAAPDAYVAKRMVQEFRPDVITLDIEMPKVDGLRFLEVMMKAMPTPVVMISTLTERGADATLRALELGAVDFMAKPKLSVAQGMAEYAAVIVEKRKVNWYRRINWGNRSNKRRYHAFSPQCTGHHYFPTHASRVHNHLRQAAR